ncbi:uncharacterized protein BT62DRAFT_1080186 [Guyanagaster necrorhizus]|uniref:Uncharacterized protein n=1 Tax=Guyanagaster necrorhizus TaxID=856835 RepID=A0A9P7VIV0_9AGAR|nr:uncharacterized protein BT62DRAFT_1080186 [Guyanagaster necrorhizus MCA 3950]KAG7441312.1 hypothetical protein BT62DRAFT_1080186 [Guyanagaster necrorhizus MCA 3950]
MPVKRSEVEEVHDQIRNLIKTVQEDDTLGDGKQLILDDLDAVLHDLDNHTFVGSIRVFFYACVRRVMAKIPEAVPSIAEIRDNVDAIETAYRDKSPLILPAEGNSRPQKYRLPNRGHRQSTLSVSSVRRDPLKQYELSSKEPEQSDLGRPSTDSSIVFRRAESMTPTNMHISYWPHGPPTQRQAGLDRLLTATSSSTKFHVSHHNSATL